MKRLFPIILIGCMAGAWVSIVYRNINVPKEYESVLASAYEAYGQGYYLKAQELLEQAGEFQGMEASYETEVLQRDIYYGMQDGSLYERQLLSMIGKYPDMEENYERIIRYHQSLGNIRDLCRYLPEYSERWPENETIRAAGQELDRSYEYIAAGYYDVKYASNILADIQEYQYESDGMENAARKLVNRQGNDVFDAGYVQMSVAQDGLSCFVCDKEGIWTRVDISQNLLARNEKADFSYVGRLSANHIATAVIDGKYHFINEEMKVSDAEWEDAGTFCNDINAVRRNGKWALVTSQSWGNVTEFPYTDIPRNSQDCCIADGYGVVADASGYYVINSEDFQPVSGNVFEEMKAFECSQPAAYREGEKWGFVNRQGEVYIEACYEDAKSFLNGYAAVQQGGLWGYIDRYGTIVVEPQFQDALNVMADGRAYVKNELGYWDYIIIARLRYAG